MLRCPVYMWAQHESSTCLAHARSAYGTALTTCIYGAALTRNGVAGQLSSGDLSGDDVSFTRRCGMLCRELKHYCAQLENVPGVDLGMVDHTKIYTWHVVQLGTDLCTVSRGCVKVGGCLVRSRPEHIWLLRPCKVQLISDIRSLRKHEGNFTSNSVEVQPHISGGALHGNTVVVVSWCARRCDVLIQRSLVADQLYLSVGLFHYSVTALDLNNLALSFPTGALECQPDSANRGFRANNQSSVGQLAQQMAAGRHSNQKWDRER